MGITVPNDPPETGMFTIPPSSMDENLEPTEKPLCTACSNLSSETLRDTRGYIHSESLQKLGASAATCALCNLIRRKIWEEMIYSRTSCADSPNASFTDQQLLDGLQVLASERGGILPESGPLVLQSDGSNSRVYEHIMFFTCAIRLDPDSNGAFGTLTGFTLCKLLWHENKPDTARPLLPRGDEQSALRRMRKWLDTSDGDLHAWSDRLTNTTLPTRVLDLGLMEDEVHLIHDADLRLLESSGIIARYITLSYSWGGYTGCRTLRSNLRERCSKIIYRELPNVFQQAITVSRYLGIRYF